MNSSKNSMQMVLPFLLLLLPIKILSSLAEISLLRTTTSSNVPGSDCQLLQNTNLAIIGGTLLESGMISKFNLENGYNSEPEQINRDFNLSINDRVNYLQLIDLDKVALAHNKGVSLISHKTGEVLFESQIEHACIAVEYIKEKNFIASAPLEQNEIHLDDFTQNKWTKISGQNYNMMNEIGPILSKVSSPLLYWGDRRAQVSAIDYSSYKFFHLLIKNEGFEVPGNTFGIFRGRKTSELLIGTKKGFVFEGDEISGEILSGFRPYSNSIRKLEILRESPLVLATFNEFFGIMFLDLDRREKIEFRTENLVQYACFNPKNNLIAFNNNFQVSFF